MQFLSQLWLGDTGIKALADRNKLLLVFQCQNDPGMCDEWEPNAGGNAALVVPATDLVPLSPPSLSPEERQASLDGPTTLEKIQGITARDYDDSRQDLCEDDAYVEAVQKKGAAVIGKLGGLPVWIQGDETPKCSCGRKMVFVAQLECTAGGGINFGDAGSGYAFACPRCKSKAKFLWQCS
jgi:hypothetical protein